jgi:hypothetical protein
MGKMGRNGWIAAFVAICLAPAAHARADCPIAPPVRLYSAVGGTTFLKVVMEKTGVERASGMLYDVLSGDERLVWTNLLVTVPGAVWVDSGQRWVVTMGTYCSSSADHALAVYDDHGMLVRDWKLGELVTNQELERRQLNVVEAHEAWTSAAGLRFEVQRNTLLVVLPWGESRVIAQAGSR